MMMMSLVVVHVPAVNRMLLKHIPNYGGPAPDVPIDNLWCLVPGLIVARVDFVLRVVFSLLYGMCCGTVCGSTSPQ